MPDHTALLHPGRRGDDEPCGIPARVAPRRRPSTAFLVSRV
jgi:hypothetical protein